MAVNTLENVALALAAKAAFRYLADRGLAAHEPTLLARLPVHVRARLAEALTDARDAFVGGRPAAAEEAFAAAMSLAGIAAAKEVGVHPN
jgi:hypothetical protein